MKRNYCHLCIRFGTWKVRRLTQSRSMVEIPKWATRNWSTQIRHVGLNWRDLFGTWEVGRLNWAWVHSHYKQCFWPIGTHVNTSFFFIHQPPLLNNNNKNISRCKGEFKNNSLCTTWRKFNKKSKKRCEVILIYLLYGRIRNGGNPNEAMCKTFLVKMSFICTRMVSHHLASLWNWGLGQLEIGLFRQTSVVYNWSFAGIHNFTITTRILRAFVIGRILVVVEK